MNQTEYKMLLLNKEFVTHNPNITADFILTNLLKFWAIPHCWLSMKQLSLGKYSRKSKINTDSVSEKKKQQEEGVTILVTCETVYTGTGK